MRRIFSPVAKFCEGPRVKNFANRMVNRTMKTGVLACAALALAGCYNSPEMVADRQDRMAAIDARGAEFYDTHFTPLIDECLSFLKTGQLDMASLATKGYTKTAFGIRKKLGPSQFDAVQIMGIQNRGECIITSPAAVGTATPLSDFLTAELAKRGFRLAGAGPRNGQLRYTKGSESLIVTGGTGRGAALTFAKG